MSSNNEVATEVLDPLAYAVANIGDAVFHFLGGSSLTPATAVLVGSAAIWLACFVIATTLRLTELLYRRVLVHLGARAKARNRRPAITWEPTRGWVRTEDPTTTPSSDRT